MTSRGSDESGNDVPGVTVQKTDLAGRVGVNRGSGAGSGPAAAGPVGQRRAGRRPARRWYGRVLVAAVAPVAWLLLAATPAWAHAELVATNPANGAHLDRAPAQVTLRFSQAVSPVHGGVRLQDGRGRQVSNTDASVTPGQPDELAVPVPGDLEDGYYVLAWRAVSLDSHPINGALLFSVGVVTGPAPAALTGGGADRAVTVVFWLIRGLGYLSLALLVGGGYFLLACRRGSSRVEHRSWRLLRAGWLGSLVAAVGALLLQGPYVSGGSLVRALDPALVQATLTDDYGLLVAARIGLVAAAWPLLTRLLAADRRPADRRVAAAGLAAAAAVGVGLALTWAAGGHARAGSEVPLALLADTVHLVAMSIWLGGLAFLVAGVLAPAAADAGPREPVAAASAALARFSQTALVAVGALVVTGLYQAWRELVGTGPVTGSPWLGLLVFKVAAFGLLIVLAVGSRSLVHSHYLRRTPEPVAAAAPAGRARTVRRRNQAEQAAAAATLAQLRRPVWFEVALAVGVLGLTAALVATSPQPSAATTPAAAPYTGPFHTDLRLKAGGTVDIWLDPARPGSNQLVINVRRPDGTNLDAPAVEAKMVLPSVDSAAVPVPLRRTGPGQFVARELAVPNAGIGRLQLRVRTAEFDAETVSLDIPVR
jgi:copper transport protein